MTTRARVRLLRTTMTLDQISTASLREVARVLGFTTPSGPMAGQGNISELVRNIPTLDPERLAWAQRETAARLALAYEDFMARMAIEQATRERQEEKPDAI